MSSILTHNYSFLDLQTLSNHEQFDLVVLNCGNHHQVSHSSTASSLFWSLWNHARLRVCADGGSNLLFDNSPADSISQADRSNQFAPSMICGDMDSLRRDVHKFYESKGVPIISSADQDTTDLEKCLKLLKLADQLFRTPKAAQAQSQQDFFSISCEQCANHAEPRAQLEHYLRDCFTSSHLNLEADMEAVHSAAEPAQIASHRAPMVILFGAFGGRFDQQMAAVHSALKMKDDFERIILLSDDNIGEILSPTSQESPHELKIVSHVQCGACGLIPFAGPAKLVHTSGFKWNLDGQELAFGNLISTSNLCESEIVTVRSDAPILFVSELKLKQ